jgi:predicted nucleic acid-binding protein
MGGNLIFLDTNILIYLLNGDVSLAEYLQDSQIVISFVTELEVLCYEMSPEVLAQVKDLLAQCHTVELNTEIKSSCIDLVKKFRLKLPDAIVAATAQSLSLPIMTADQQFEKVTGLDLILYSPRV